MKKERGFFLFGILLLFSITLVMAQPPFQNSITASKSILIETPVIEYHQQNQDLIFNLHPHNSTDGQLISHGDISYCLVHMYEPNNRTHLVQANMTPNINEQDYELLVLGGNFSSLGQYAVYMYCQGNSTGDLRGGYFEFGFDVNKNGINPNQYENIFIFGLIGIIALFIVLGFAFKEKWKVKSFFFMMASLVGVILLNSLRLILSSSEDLNKMMEISLWIGIIVLLFIFMYLFVYALIEVFHYFRKRDIKRWEVGDEN